MDSAFDLFLQAIPSMVAGLLVGIAWWFIAARITAGKQVKWAHGLNSLPLQEQVLLVRSGSPRDRLFLLGLLIAGLIIFAAFLLAYLLLG